MHNAIKIIVLALAISSCAVSAYSFVRYPALIVAQESNAEKLIADGYVNRLKVNAELERRGAVWRLDTLNDSNASGYIGFNRDFLQPDGFGTYYQLVRMNAIISLCLTLGLFFVLFFFSDSRKIPKKSLGV